MVREEGDGMALWRDMALKQRAWRCMLRRITEKSAP